MTKVRHPAKRAEVAANTAYAAVGHLPLAGGTLVGNVIHDPASGSITNKYDVPTSLDDVDFHYNIDGTLTALYRWDSSLNTFSWMDRDPSAVTRVSMNMDTGAFTIVGRLYVNDTTEGLRLTDTNGTANSGTPFVSYYDAVGTRLGYAGFGSGANSDMYVVAAGGDVHLFAGDAEAIRAEDPATLGATETSLWLYDDDNGTFQQVTVGADDSGGSGFKVLRIAN